MGSVPKYLEPDRRFIDTYYRECGREVTLAYTVLNQTNTWAITLFVALVGAAASQLVLVDKDASAFRILSPSHPQWLMAIVCWGAMLRFFQRSNLALANMYRWNALMGTAMQFSILPDNAKKELRAQLSADLVEKIQELHVEFKAPLPLMTIVVNNLKLMYGVPFVLLAVSIVLGLVALSHNRLYWMGAVLLVMWTGWEFFLFRDLFVKDSSVAKVSVLSTMEFLAPVSEPKPEASAVVQSTDGE